MSASSHKQTQATWWRSASPADCCGLLATAGPLLGPLPEHPILIGCSLSGGASPAVRTRPTKLRGPAPGAFSLLGSVAAKAQRREHKCATLNELVQSRTNVRMILAPSGSFPLGASSLAVID